MTSTLQSADHVTIYDEVIHLPRTKTLLEGIQMAAAIESFVVNQECRNFRHFAICLNKWDAGLIWKPAQEPGLRDTHQLYIEPGGQLDRSLNALQTRG